MISYWSLPVFPRAQETLLQSPWTEAWMDMKDYYIISGAISLLALLHHFLGH